VVAAVCAALTTGCATDSAAYRDQRVFTSSNAAVTALETAARKGDAEELQAIFGSDAKAVLSSGDPVMDRMNRQVFSVAMQERWALHRRDSASRDLIVGFEEWPFPIPLVKDKRGWWFDTQAGAEEIRARRIGRNELSAIGTLQAYVIAQNEYAFAGHDGRPAGIYAQRVRSQPGMRDGLYWAMQNADDAPSPLGEFAANAADDGYDTQSTSAEPRPFHGYIFRILKGQGPAAPGGAMSYLVAGDMTGGFAMIAYPVQYGNSGIMTFIVGPDGTVFESDLGENTPATASAYAEFNPDASWHPVD